MRDFSVPLNRDRHMANTAAEWDGKRWINRTAIRDDQKAIFGAQWNKTSSPTLTRTDEAVGMVANAGVGFATVVNDFDYAPIFGEFEEVMDTLGNVFVRIPKFYIRKLNGATFLSWQVSKHRHPGFYLPWCFWDFTNNRELPFIDVGKYKGTSEVIAATTRLRSLPNVFPLINTTIVNMRTFATNNNVAPLAGYQQLDIHVIDLLQTLFYIEFATLNSQAIMSGFSTGQYNATHTATVAETAVNRIIVANAHADLFRVGQTISIGTSLGGNQIFYGRTITGIATFDASNRAISFDGAPVSIAVGNIVYNTGWRNGFSLGGIAATSGSQVSNTDGRWAMTYRGIESLYGDMWQFVDGVNIDSNQAWVCRNAAQYASNVFAHPYERLGYVNSVADGLVTAMGFDAFNPFVQLPVAAGGSATTFYSDSYWQGAGQRIALFGGDWSFGSALGVSYWNLDASSAGASVGIGGRLLKKPL